MKYNFEVKEAVWIGTAVMSYIQYQKSINAGKEVTGDMFWFEQSEIRKTSQMLTCNTVQPARITQWFNGDHENNSNNYLRAKGTLRRLTAKGEFSGLKERPETLDDNLSIDLYCLDEQVHTTLGMLFKWVDEVYSSFYFDEENILEDSVESSRRKGKDYCPNYDIKELSFKINSFYSEILKDKNARFKSWEHCYSYFQIHRKEKSCIELMALHLAFYLASWGMYRGSSFLLQKDYKIHIPIIEVLMENKYECLSAVSAEKLLLQETQDLVLELKERMVDTYKQKITDTLATKILLGTLGCTPAYDRYFNYGLRKHNVAPAILNNSSLEGIAKFYLENYNELECIRDKINSHGIIYPQMKILDMCFWQVGIDDDIDKEYGDDL